MPIGQILPLPAQFKAADSPQGERPAVKQFRCGDEMWPGELYSSLCVRYSDAYREGKTPQLTSSERAAEVVAHMAVEPQELLVLVPLDSQLRMMGLVEVHRGNIDSAQVDPRLVFGILLTMGATAFMVAHNHPGGDPNPSDEDRSLNEFLWYMANELGYRYMEFLIVAARGVFSGRRAGWNLHS